MCFHADEVQNRVGFAQQTVGAYKKIETAAKAEFSDREAAIGSVTCALDEIEGRINTRCTSALPSALK